jgi:hypothetical protein
MSTTNQRAKLPNASLGNQVGCCGGRGRAGPPSIKARRVEPRYELLNSPNRSLAVERDDPHDAGIAACLLRHTCPIVVRPALCTHCFFSSLLPLRSLSGAISRRTAARCAGNFTEDVIASGRPTRKVATRCCLNQARFLCFFEQVA